MSLVTTGYDHIVLNEKGTPVIRGTRHKVKNIVLDKLAHGWSPEEILYQHPHLTMAQIYSALAYYEDHQSEMDTEIERDLRVVEEMRRNAKPSPLVARLREMGLI